jgi:ketosteroid isomerase-like protein
MPEKPIDVVRRIHEAWARGEKASGLIAGDVVYVNPPDAVEPGTRLGSQMFDRVGDVYEDFRPQVERMVEVGDRVLVIAGGTARLREPGGEVPIRQGYVWTVEGGRAVRFEWFNRPEEALAAVGLQASADSASSG